MFNNAIEQLIWFDSTNCYAQSLVEACKIISEMFIMITSKDNVKNRVVDLSICLMEKYISTRHAELLPAFLLPQ